MATWVKVLSGTVPPVRIGSAPLAKCTPLKTWRVPPLFWSQSEKESVFAPRLKFWTHLVTTPINAPLAGRPVGRTQASMLTLFASLSAAGLPIVTLLLPPKLNACPTFPVAKVTPFVLVPLSKVGPWISLKFPSAGYHATRLAGGSTQLSSLVIVPVPTALLMVAPPGL